MKRENVEFLHRLCGVLETTAAALSDKDVLKSLPTMLYDMLEGLDQLLREEGGGGKDDGKAKEW